MNALELKIPPVLLALLVAGGMWFGSKQFAVLNVAIPWRTAPAIVIAVIGTGFAIAGVLAFRRHGTTLNPTTPEAAASVVSTGVFRVSRNPMYVGLLLLLSGWGIFLANLFALLLVPVFVAWMNRFQIVPEERALSARFGDQYVAYQRSVRRWL